ncbi:MAG: hypothetical protein PHX63_08505, partial [Eubacteriales bacterium]|nr:hypothetical protein [Eubacteriales bacterium]
LSQIWVWERDYNHSSALWGGIGFRPDAMKSVSVAALDLNRLSYEITALQNEVPEVGIIYSDANILNIPSSMHAAYEAYEAAIYNGKAVQFVTDTQEWKMNDCKLVIVPRVEYISEAMLVTLKRYIEKGGKVLIMGEDMLKKSEHNTENNKELVDFIIVDNSQ